MEVYFEDNYGVLEKGTYRLLMSIKGAKNKWVDWYYIIFEIED